MQKSVKLMVEKSYDAIVVGSGPNGLAAAIVLLQEGLKVLLIEGKDQVGGGMRTKEVTLPGFHHDICSAIHPLVLSTPFFKSLPLADFGLSYLHPEILAAHPLLESDSVALYSSLEQTADALGVDGIQYKKLIAPLVSHWEDLTADFLGPLKVPKNPVKLAAFGINALQPATWMAKSFKNPQAKALLGGMAAHSIQPLSNWATSAIGMVLMASGHVAGWPVAKGGSQSLANALLGYFVANGGEFKSGWMVKDINELPQAKAILFDVSPRHLLKIAGNNFSKLYKWQLGRYKYGMGVFKADFALSGPVPWLSEKARKAGTVHLGGSFDEIKKAEDTIWKGGYPDNPYVLVAQQSIVDPTRAPEGKHTLWAYCHVPAGSNLDISDTIIRQVEKYAPGFGELILASTFMNAQDFEAYNPNYIGGDINAGVQDITQIFTRPAMRVSPYRTSAKGVYICSSSTPPGGGVHGMCGVYAGKQVIKDLF